jgi:hypothetical protein
VAKTDGRGPAGRVQVGFGLISVSILIAAIGVSVLPAFPETGLRILIAVLFLAAIGVLWAAAIRNGRAERVFRKRLKEQHPGALVERVILWSLPKGRVEPGTPMQFLVADATEILFETINETVLLRFPVEELSYIDLVTAQGDRVKDKALTLIYGEEQNVVQLFTITYSANDRLGARLRKAIAWPATGAPGRA